jgi:RecA/RadA recombinase
MAKKKTNVDNLLNAIRKRTDSASFATSDLLKIDDWISTGSYAINRIISGDIHKGIPSGRIITLAGESQSGKSWIAATLVKNALTQNNYDIVFYIDSEGGGLDVFLENEGVDLNKVEHILVNSVEACSTKLLYLYDQIEKTRAEQIEANEEPIKALVVLDSFGALVAEKLITDAVNKDKQVSDMGSTARLKNAMMKSMMTRVMKTKCSLVVLNHVYDDPSAMFTTKIKCMPGGQGIQFASHIIVQTSKKLEKDDNTKEAAYFKGNTLRFFTVKNRIIKPGFTAECFIDFDKGINKWEGLIAEARRLGFIEGGTAGRYKVPTYSDKTLRLNDLLTNDAIWESFLDAFNEKSKAEIQYGSKSNIDNELDDLENGIVVGENDI